MYAVSAHNLPKIEIAEISNWKLLIHEECLILAENTHFVLSTTTLT